MVGGLEHDVSLGVAVPADAVAAAFDSLFVGDDLVDGVLSEYWRFWRLVCLYGTLVKIFGFLCAARNKPSTEVY